MIQKSTQWFVDRLIERIFPAIGSFFAASLQRTLIIGHAQQHDQLEEQARIYEEQGKPHLAAMIREQAIEISSTDPLSRSDEIVGQLARGVEAKEFQLAITEETSKPKRKRQKGGASKVERGANS